MSGQISPRLGNNFPIAKRAFGAAQGFVAFLHCTFATAVCDHNARARLACRTVHPLCKFRCDSGRDFIRQRQQGYLSVSTPVHIDAVRAWPFHQRLLQDVIGMMAPLL